MASRQFEMADEALFSADGVLVAFLAEHDFIDKMAQLRAIRRHPGRVGRCNGRLERFQQGHKIPNRENVVLHEAP